MWSALWMVELTSAPAVPDSQLTGERYRINVIQRI
jgi:hypothetical protein